MREPTPEDPRFDTARFYREYSCSQEFRNLPKAGSSLHPLSGDFEGHPRVDRSYREPLVRPVQERVSSCTSSSGLTWSSKFIRLFFWISPLLVGFVVVSFTSFNPHTSGICVLSSMHRPVSDDRNYLDLHLRILALEKKVFRLSRDHTARPDFALRYTGATIIPELTDPPVNSTNDVAPNPPSIALDDDMRVGRCWASRIPSQLGISLPMRIKISHITLDHIAKELVLSIAQAPREIIVWGVIDPMNAQDLEAVQIDLHEVIDSLRDTTLANTSGLRTIPISLLRYDATLTDNVQTFPVFDPISRHGISFSQIIVHVISNWGHDEWMCLYRVRIHGELDGRDHF